MHIDLSVHPVIDNHCHPFVPARETKPYERYWTLSHLDFSAEDLKDSLIYRMVIRELARFLEMPSDAPPDAVAEERTRLYRGDTPAYLRRLFADAKIEGLILDLGYPVPEYTGYSADMKDFRALLPGVEMDTMIRIEPLLNRLLARDMGFDETKTAYLETLVEEVENNGAVAIKSAIAYQTGLDVDLVDEVGARRGFDAMMRDGDRTGEKAFRDYALLLALEICRERGLPIQIHTGVGDSPVVNLSQFNPILLFDLLSGEAYRDIQFVLVHAGYPFTGEAGFLAHTYPNVWIDVSEMVPFAGVGIRDQMMRILEMTPVTRVMYGSDGYNIPEMFWFSAIYFKRVFGEILDALVRDGTVGKNFAREMASMVLTDNARRLYLSR